MQRGECVCVTHQVAGHTLNRAAPPAVSHIKVSAA